MGRHRIFTGAGFRMGWYHNACVGSRHVEIIHCDRCPSTESENWLGPFRTWGEAKADAIAYHRTDLENAREAIRNIRSMRRDDK